MHTHVVMGFRIHSFQILPILSPVDQERNIHFRFQCKNNGLSFQFCVNHFETLGLSYISKFGPWRYPYHAKIWYFHPKKKKKNLVRFAQILYLGVSYKTNVVNMPASTRFHPKINTFREQTTVCGTQKLNKQTNKRFIRYNKSAEFTWQRNDRMIVRYFWNIIISIV